MIYEYECKNCGQDWEAHRPIHRHDDGPVCHCGTKTVQVIRTAPKGYVDNMTTYECPVTHEAVTTRRQRNYIMESNDLIDANDFASTHEERKRRKAEKQAEIDKIKSEVPEDLKREFTKMVKQEEQAFKSGLG